MRNLLLKKKLRPDLFSTKHVELMETEKHAAFLHEKILQRANKDGSQRTIHGTPHATRVALFTLIFDDLLNRHDFPTSLSDEDRQLLFIAALWHDAGREGDDKDYWEKDSAELLYYYLTLTVKVNPEKAMALAEAIANKDYIPGKTQYHSMVVVDDMITWENNITPNQKNIFQIEIHEGDCVDIIRVVNDRFDIKELDFYKKVACRNQKARKELDEFILEVKYLIEVHEKNRLNYNVENCYALTLKLIQTDSRFSYLRKYYSGPKKWLNELTLFSDGDDRLKNQLISLSKKIEIEAQFKWLRIFLNKYKIVGHQAIADFLNRTHNSGKSLDEIIKEEQKALDNSVGRLYKVVPSTKECYWPDIVGALKDLTGYRPELRQRVARLPYTSRLWNKQYVVLPTDKIAKQEAIKALPFLVKTENKNDYTRPQSLSYCNPEIGYNPKPYPGRDVAENDPVVGVSFPVTECSAPRRIMIFNTLISTFGRTQDAETAELAKKFVDENLGRSYFSTYVELQNHALFNDNTETTEVTAGYHWTPNADITIFKENHLESHLLAQVRALDLRLQFQNTMQVSIAFYPDFHRYELAQQEADQAAAKNAHLEHYLHALSFLSGKKIIDPNESITVLKKTAELLKRNAPTAAAEFNVALAEWTRDLNRKFLVLLDTEFAWVKRDKLNELRNLPQNNTATDTQLSQIQFLIRASERTEKQTPWDHVLFLEDIDSIGELSADAIDCSNTRIKILDEIRSLQELTTALLQIPVEKEQLISTIVANKQHLFQTISDVFVLAKTLASRKSWIVYYSKENLDAYKDELRLICKSVNFINCERLFKTGECFYDLDYFARCLQESRWGHSLFFNPENISYIASELINNQEALKQFLDAFWHSLDWQNLLLIELCTQQKITTLYAHKTSDQVIASLKTEHGIELDSNTSSLIQEAFLTSEHGPAESPRL